MFASSMGELLELTLRIMNDESPSPKEGADAVFIFGQTPDNEKSVLYKATQLFRQGLVNKVVYSTGGVLVNGQPWAPFYRLKLIDLGVMLTSIVHVEITEKLAHTSSEAQSFVAYAKKQNWKKVYVTAAPFHQPRAFLSTVSSILKNYPELKAYSLPGTHLAWTEVALHSQFAESGRRCDLVGGELSRMDTYHASGDLVSARQVLDYLNNRDK